MQSITNEPWAILNKCERMVDTYIADMDKHLSCSEWPDSYPEPKYLITIHRYINRTRLQVDVHINLQGISIVTTNPKFIYCAKNALGAYLIAIIQKLYDYKQDLNR